MTTQEEIRNKARAIWEKEGRPEGRDWEHWLQAEAELRRSSPGENLEQNLAQEASMLMATPGLNKDNGSRGKRTARRAK